MFSLPPVFHHLNHLSIKISSFYKFLRVPEKREIGNPHFYGLVGFESTCVEHIPG